MADKTLEIFAIFYAVLFGALLSAEIGLGHFKIEYLSAIQPTYCWLPT